MTPERDDCRFLGFSQNRRARFRRPRLQILDRRTPAPRCHRLGVDAQFPTQLREQSLRSFGLALGPMAGQPSLLQLGQRAWSWRSRDELVP